MCYSTGFILPPTLVKYVTRDPLDLASVLKSLDFCRGSEGLRVLLRMLGGFRVPFRARKASTGLWGFRI